MSDTKWTEERARQMVTDILFEAGGTVDAISTMALGRKLLPVLVAAEARIDMDVATDEQGRLYCTHCMEPQADGCLFGCAASMLRAALSNLRGG